MKEVYVITAEQFNGSCVYAGYEDSSRAMPVWYEENEEWHAQEFSTVENAKSWYNGAKKYLDSYFKENCYPYSACIQKKIIRCDYHVVEHL